MVRVGCGQAAEDGVGLSPQAIESSFVATGAAGTSAIWLSWSREPVSPTLEHFLHPSNATADLSWALEPVSPALEHILHPVVGTP